ncbi:MAG: family oxidoreductase [Verrucomicrobiaceae bacterium]|nr:family oxidoreductase [Verrucomicrobiaceae bacterium]
MARDVIVITGLGGMGSACARRLGAGHKLLLADIDAESLHKTAEVLRDDGFDVEAHVVDVADVDAITVFAQRAAALGFVRAIVHTAGLSPLMANAARIYAVDLVGTANVLDAFSNVVGSGSVAVMIASIASFVYPRDADLEMKLATLPATQLCDLALAHNADDPNMAYALAKRGNQLRVEETAITWGQRGARVISISPGLVSTPMGRLEQQGEHVAALLKLTPLQRIATAEDIAATVQWLIDPAANYINGADIRIDGGLVAAMRSSGMVQR